VGKPLFLRALPLALKRKKVYLEEEEEEEDMKRILGMVLQAVIVGIGAPPDR